MLSLQGEVLRLIGGSLCTDTTVKTVFNQEQTVRYDLATCFSEETFVLQTKKHRYAFYFRFPERLLCCMEVWIDDNQLVSVYRYWKGYHPRYNDVSSEIACKTEKLQQKAIEVVSDLPAYRLLAVTGEIKI